MGAEKAADCRPSNSELSFLAVKLMPSHHPALESKLTENKSIPLANDDNSNKCFDHKTKGLDSLDFLTCRLCLSFSELQC